MTYLDAGQPDDVRLSRNYDCKITMNLLQAIGMSIIHRSYTMLPNVFKTFIIDSLYHDVQPSGAQVSSGLDHRTLCELQSKSFQMWQTMLTHLNDADCSKIRRLATHPKPSFPDPESAAAHILSQFACLTVKQQDDMVTSITQILINKIHKEKRLDGRLFDCLASIVTVRKNLAEKSEDKRLSNIASKWCDLVKHYAYKKLIR